MPTIDEILKEFPPRTREKVKAVWEALPKPTCAVQIAGTQNYLRPTCPTLTYSRQI
jgi:hypothetical protein